MAWLLPVNKKRNQDLDSLHIEAELAVLTFVVRLHNDIDGTGTHINGGWPYLLPSADGEKLDFLPVIIVDGRAPLIQLGAVVEMPVRL